MVVAALLLAGALVGAPCATALELRQQAQRPHLDALPALLEASGPACVSDLLELLVARPEHAVSGAVAERLGEVAGPEHEAALYEAFARVQLRPWSPSEDGAHHLAAAIEALRGGADLLAPLRADDALADRWLELVWRRYQAHWGGALRAEGVEPLSWSQTGGDRARADLRRCLAYPRLAPVDPWDPLEILAGPRRPLGRATRCASRAVLLRWTAPDAPSALRERVTSWWEPDGRAVDQLGAGRATLDAALAGIDAEPVPARTPPWRPGPRPPGAASAWLVVGVLGLVVGLRRWGRKLGFPLAAMALGGLAPLAVEGLLALAGVQPGDLAVEPTSEPLEELDGALLDLRGRPFPPDPAGRPRVAVLGASSVQGTYLPWPQTIPARLQHYLRRSAPCVDVAALGRPGAALGDLRPLAVSAVRQLGVEHVVLCAGHNEVGDLRERVAAGAGSPALLWVRGLVTRTRLGGLLARALPRRREAPSGGGGELPLVRLHRLASLRAAQDADGLARWLEAQGVGLTITLPAFNHHYMLVGGSVGEEPVELGEARAALQAGRWGDLRVLAERDPLRELPLGVFLGALAAEVQGDRRAAEDGLWRVSTLTANAGVATPGIHRALQAVAHRHGLPLADAHAATHEGAEPRNPGMELFFDFVHPTAAGADLIAAEMERTLADAGLVDAWAARCR